MSNYGKKVQEIMESKFNDMPEKFARTLAEREIEVTMYSSFPRYNADMTINTDYSEYETEQGGFAAVLGGVGSHDYF